MLMKNGEPKVSILVPIYNVEKFLPQCLESLIHQTLEDIEIICLDDGSTDNSPEIIRKYAKQDTRIRIITKKNTGYGDTMNLGISVAKGMYIGIVESDDFASLEMFKKLFDLAVKYNVEIVKSRFWLYWDDIGKRQSSKIPFLKYDAVIKPTDYPNIFTEISIWSAIYKRSFLINNTITFQTTPGASYQDASFAFKALAKVNAIYFTSEAFLNYRQDNPNSSVKATSWEKIMYSIGEVKETERFLKNNKVLFAKLHAILNTIKLKTYLSNMERAQNGNRRNLYDYIKNDVAQIYDSELFVKELFRRVESLQVYLIAKRYFYGLRILYFLKNIKHSIYH